MRSLASWMVISVLLLAGPISSRAGDAAKDAGKEVRLTGYITDEWCGAKNANPEGAGCARDCAKKGSELAIYSDGKLYRLSAKDKALEYLGVRVVVTGTLDAEGKAVEVRSIEKAKEQA
jgi:hypothetical protein